VLWRVKNRKTIIWLTSAMKTWIFIPKCIPLRKLIWAFLTLLSKCQTTRYRNAVDHGKSYLCF